MSQSDYQRGASDGAREERSRIVMWHANEATLWSGARRAAHIAAAEHIANMPAPGGEPMRDMAEDYKRITEPPVSRAALRCGEMVGSTGFSCELPQGHAARYPHQGYDPKADKIIVAAAAPGPISDAPAPEPSPYVCASCLRHVPENAPCPYCAPAPEAQAQSWWKPFADMSSEGVLGQGQGMQIPGMELGKTEEGKPRWTMLEKGTCEALRWGHGKSGTPHVQSDECYAWKPAPTPTGEAHLHDNCDVSCALDDPLPSSPSTSQGQGEASECYWCSAKYPRVLSKHFVSGAWSTPCADLPLGTEGMTPADDEAGDDGAWQLAIDLQHGAYKSGATAGWRETAALRIQAHAAREVERATAALKASNDQLRAALDVRDGQIAQQESYCAEHKDSLAFYTRGFLRLEREKAALEEKLVESDRLAMLISERIRSRSPEEPKKCSRPNQTGGD